MKYRINERPRGSVVPEIELIEGKKGRIKSVGLYPHGSVFHSNDRLGDDFSYELLHNPVFGMPKILSECNDGHLGKISFHCKYPLEELKEIRELERQARDSGIVKD